MTPEPPARDDIAARAGRDRSPDASQRPSPGPLEEALGVDVATLETLLERMRCPVCGAAVAKDGAALRCTAGHAVPVTDGYLDASGVRSGDASGDATRGDVHAGDATAGDATAKTFASFGYEWTTFSETREEDEDYAEHYLRDLDVGRLAGRIGLDAGCGRARYTRFLAPHLDAVVALDGSDAVLSAARNLSDMPNAVVVRSDLRQAPFAAGSFGFIASFGVLHHLEDPRAGFDRLLELLAPGGVLSLYLYSRPERAGARGFGLAAAAALRRLTVRLPHRVLRALCTPIAALLFVTVVAAGRFGDAHGIQRFSTLPMGTYRDKPFRSLVLDTFDRLSAPVEHRFIWAELAPWFSESGLVVDSARDDSGWFVVAHRPGEPA
jgi:SAM-dependent methyltransferase